MTRTLAALAAALFLTAAAASGAMAQDDDRYGSQKVVYHINQSGGDEGGRYRAAMNNVQNQINAVGADNIEVQVVMHGAGLDLLMDAQEDQGLQTLIGGLKSQGVAFKVCANTLKGRDIALDDLYDAWDEDIVPSGVAEISHLQQEGFTYMKP